MESMAYPERNRQQKITGKKLRAEAVSRGIRIVWETVFLLSPEPRDDALCPLTSRPVLQATSDYTPWVLLS